MKICAKCNKSIQPGALEPVLWAFVNWHYNCIMSDECIISHKSLHNLRTGLN